MRIVDEPVIRPHRCAVLRQIGGVRPGGYVDTGNDLDREHVYVSDVGVRELMKTFGFPAPETFEEVEARLTDVLAELAQVQADKAELEREIDAIHVMRSRGWTPAKKPGRPKKQPKEEVAVNG